MSSITFSHFHFISTPSFPFFFFFLLFTFIFTPMSRPVCYWCHISCQENIYLSRFVFLRVRSLNNNTYYIIINFNKIRFSKNFMNSKKVQVCFYKYVCFSPLKKFLKYKQFKLFSWSLSEGNLKNTREWKKNWHFKLKNYFTQLHFFTKLKTRFIHSVVKCWDLTIKVITQSSNQKDVL